MLNATLLRNIYIHLQGDQNCPLENLCQGTVEPFFVLQEAFLLGNCQPWIFLIGKQLNSLVRLRETLVYTQRCSYDREKRDAQTEQSTRNGRTTQRLQGVSAKDTHFSTATSAAHQPLVRRPGHSSRAQR